MQRFVQGKDYDPTKVLGKADFLEKTIKLNENYDSTIKIWVLHARHILIR